MTIILYSSRVVKHVEMVRKSWNRLETYILENYELLSGKKQLGKGLEVVEQTVLRQSHGVN